MRTMARAEHDNRMARYESLMLEDHSISKALRELDEDGTVDARTRIERRECLLTRLAECRRQQLCAIVPCAGCAVEGLN